MGMNNTTTINGITYVIDQIITADDSQKQSPNATADMLRRGWDAIALLRRPNGQKLHTAYRNLRDGSFELI